MRTLYILVPLFALLAAAVWFAAATFVHMGGDEAPPIPTWGWFAIAGGVGFSLLVGISLMALVFYSSRHGYDDTDQRD
jgi:hypothetical protein